MRPRAPSSTPTDDVDISQRVSLSDRSFPTLASRLELLPSSRPTSLRPLLLVIEAGEGAADIEAALARVITAAPPSSVISVVEDGIARTAPVDRADKSSLSRGPSFALKGFDGLRALLDDSPGADLVLIEPSRDVSAEALDRLATAAHADSICATVSDVESVETLAEAPIPAPAIEVPLWGLVLVRRDALELTLEDARFAASADPKRVASQRFASMRELLARLLDAPGLVHRASGRAPAASLAAPNKHGSTSPISVTMDVRFIAGPVSGTQVQFLNLLAALARTGEVELTALAPAHIHPSELPLVEPLRADVVFSASNIARQADIFHRPHQVMSIADLAGCFKHGRRFVLTQQDMIVDRAAAYWPSTAQWQDFRRTTRAALSSADHVGFFSEHAALDALSDGFLDPERTTVVPLGVDHVDVDGEADPPPRLAELGGRPFLFMMGTALRHKNRLFALRVLRELVTERGWEGGLVLAGSDFPWGSSTPEEGRLMERDSPLRERVVDLGAVSEREKRALYREARLVLFPSFYEGFGLIPFEAAAFGKPCLYAWRGPVAEFLPDTGALPVDFSATATASTILALLGDVGARESLVAAIRSAGARLTWQETARGYMEVYRRALEAPPRSIDRAILAPANGSGPNAGALTVQEVAVISAYRRHASFKTVVDSLMRAGTAAVRVGRRGRARLARPR
jgi:glycosyltransferase involved in cell wall biosynthesis